MGVTMLEDYFELPVLKTISQFSYILLRKVDEDKVFILVNTKERYTELEKSFMLRLSLFHSIYRVFDE